MNSIDQTNGFGINKNGKELRPYGIFFIKSLFILIPFLTYCGCLYLSIFHVETFSRISLVTIIGGAISFFICLIAGILGLILAIILNSKGMIDYISSNFLPFGTDKMRVFIFLFLFSHIFVIPIIRVLYKFYRHNILRRI